VIDVSLRPASFHQTDPPPEKHQRPPTAKAGMNSAQNQPFLQDQLQLNHISTP
jgi:hypothetical protein